MWVVGDANPYNIRYEIIIVGYGLQDVPQANTMKIKSVIT